VPTPQPQLRRVRWLVRLTLILAVAASVAANVLHARPDPVAQIIAGWPPLALLLTVDLISRVPVDRRVLAAARIIATTGIAGIAAWVSYWHMAAVGAHYGETGASPYLLPLSVDGLVIVASISLVELATRIRDTETPPHANNPADTPAAATPRTPAKQPAEAPVPDAAPRQPTIGEPRDRYSTPAAQPPPRHPSPQVASHTRHDAAPTPAHPPVTNQTTETSGDVGAAAPAPAATVKPPNAHPPAHPHPADTPPADTTAAVAYWRAQDPNLRVTDIAQKIGRSQRTVRRVLAELADTAATETPSSVERPTGTPINSRTLT
jgi:hypothetical protein